MLLYVFLVLGVWNGVLGSDDLCDKPEAQACKKPDDISFPKTEEDINRMCPIVTEGLDCVKNYYDKCRYGRHLTEFELQNITDLIKEICLENSRLHAGVVQHIGCFNDVIENSREICIRYITSNRGKMRNYLHDIEAERGYSDDYYDLELWQPYSCISKSLEIICITNRVSEKCGSDAKDIATEVLTRTIGDRHSCPTSSEERIAELLALLELELEEEALMRRLIRKE